MYPRNAASPPRIAVGAVVQISDGAVQTSGVSIAVVPEGGASGAGGGTTSYDNGIVLYVPTQAETNYAAFVVTAYKTGCIPVAQTIVTSASATSGKVVLSGETHTSAVIPTVTTLTGHTAQTGDTYALANGANGFVAIKGDTAAILADTGTDGVVVAAGSKTGYSLTATTGLGNQTADITGSLSGSVGSVTGAVGSVTNERGKYANGAVWIGPTANTNTTSYTDGIITNPVSTIAAAKTIADALGLRRFYTVRTGTVQIGEAMAGYDFDGQNWSCTTTGGSRDVGTSHFVDADVVGGTFASTSGAITWEVCEFATGVTVGVSDMVGCRFAGDITLSTAGNYDFVDCCSAVAGTSAPTFTVPAGTVNISFRRWSGGITISGITTGTTVSIDVVSGGAVTLNGADGNVQIRGMAASVTDNRTGSPTLGQTAVVNRTTINAEVVDTLATDTYAELGAVPAATSTLAAKINWLFALARNKLTQTATTATLRNDADSGNIATAATSDDSTTYTRAEWT